MQGLGLFLQGQYEIPTGARRLMGVTPRRKHLGSFANTQLSGNLTNVSLLSPDSTELVRADFTLLISLCTFYIVFFFFLGEEFVRP